ncbi:hypothetical protein TNCV_4438801 [Trichonephila clavipes]|nr:hypothetical protein TNCV_4438801 [Trichonephila clavipes]
MDNPHLMLEIRSQYECKINMWTGILSGKITGPLKLPKSLNGAKYLNFLQNKSTETCGFNKMDAQGIASVPARVFRYGISRYVDWTSWFNFMAN